jgi:hypothetical protein
MYFIPRAYPHHIENIGAGEIRFLIFFDQGNTEDIGYTGGLRAYSNEVLGATFDCDPKFFEKLPPYAEDALIGGAQEPGRSLSRDSFPRRNLSTRAVPPLVPATAWSHRASHWPLRSGCKS